MKPGTLNAIAAILAADPPTNSAERGRVLAILGGGQAETAPRVLSRTDAAGRLGVSVRTVDALCAAGELGRVRLPGRARACGVRESDVERLISRRVA
jgi:hypothetical protein